MRVYILENNRRFLGNLTVTFVQNDSAIATTKSINKRLNEEDKFGICSSRSFGNLQWTLETNEEISERLYAEYMRTPIFINE